MAEQKSKKLTIVMFAVLAAIIVGLTTTLIVLAATGQNISSSINVSYTATGIYGTASATYKLGNSNEEISMTNDSGNKITFKDTIIGSNLLSPEAVVLTNDNSFVVFKYTFTNEREDVYYAEMTYQDTNEQDKNILVTYSLDGINFSEEHNYVEVPAKSNEVDATINYYIKVSVLNRAKDAIFTGTIQWNLTEDKPTKLFFSYDNSYLTATVIGAKDGLEKLVIPETTKYNGQTYTVDSIGNSDHLENGTFPNCKTTLTAVEFPKTIKRVYGTAFLSCNKITSVNFLGTIEEWLGIDFQTAMFGTDYGFFSNPVISSHKVLFNGEEITEVTIPNNVIDLSNVFPNCTSIKKVTIPSTVKTVSPYAFYKCENIEEVIYLGTINDWASIHFSSGYMFDTFSQGRVNGNPVQYSKKLIIDGQDVTEVVINNIKSYTNCLTGTFKGLQTLTKVTLDNQIRGFDLHTFYDCINLKEIIIENTNKVIEVVSIVYDYGGSPLSDLFFNCPDDIQIKVPQSLVEEYKTAKYWKNYADNIIGF